MNPAKTEDLRKATPEQIYAQRSRWQQQKSRKADIGLDALRQCLAASSDTEFVIHFIPTKRPVRTKGGSVLFSVKDPPPEPSAAAIVPTSLIDFDEEDEPPEDDAVFDDAWDLSHSSAYFAAMNAEMKRFKESLGRVCIYNTAGNYLFSATIRYRMFVELVYRHNAYWPLRPEKDDKFERAMTKSRRDFAPFLMIVSKNGHGVTALRELRTKFPKFKPKENT